MVVLTFGLVAHLFILCFAKEYENKIATAGVMLGDDKHEHYLMHTVDAPFDWCQQILLLSVPLGYKGFVHTLDRYLIACHSTDFECFKRQYASLRDHFLIGNPKLAIEYEPYVFDYGNSGTCIKITGVESSELIAISMDSKIKEYSLLLEMPVRVQQVFKESNMSCATPDKEFTNVLKHEGPLRKFSGNATVHVIYPYTLRKKKGHVFMQLDEENLDVVLDIPDLSLYDRDSALETKLYEWSEWAYDAVHHINLASQSIAPFTSNLNLMLERIPLDRFILLYPEEEYTDLQIQFGPSFEN